MADKEPQFTVSDRRKFTIEGERRYGEETTSDAPSSEAAATAAPETAAPEKETEEIPEPTAAESAQQRQEYSASTRQLDDFVRQGNPGAQAPAMNFDRLVQSIYMTAAIQMGAGAEPNEQPRIDLTGARQSIDMLGVLEEKTKGNLTEDEKRLLQTVLFDLRISFVDITNAINKQAQQRPPQAGVKR